MESAFSIFTLVTWISRIASLEPPLVVQQHGAKPLGLRFIVAVTLDGDSLWPIVGSAQVTRCKVACPDPADLFIDVLAKVGYVKNAIPIVQVRIHQVSPEAFEHG
jgi:hypothetical protein